MWISCGGVSEETFMKYMDNPEVEAMPTYPNEGSIKVIDGVIVVKFDPY